MGQLRVMKPGKGDVLLAEWDVKKPETVGISKAEFEKMMGTGKYFAYEVDGKENVALQEFKESATSIVFVPKGQGG